MLLSILKSKGYEWHHLLVRCISPNARVNILPLFADTHSVSFLPMLLSAGPQFLLWPPFHRCSKESLLLQGHLHHDSHTIKMRWGNTESGALRTTAPGQPPALCASKGLRPLPCDPWPPSTLKGLLGFCLFIFVGLALLLSKQLYTVPLPWSMSFLWMHFFKWLPPNPVPFEAFTFKDLDQFLYLYWL